MADEKKIVKVKLRARCLVDGQVREAGEVVEMPLKADDGGDLAAAFGDVVKADVAPAKAASGEKVG